MFLTWFLKHDCVWHIINHAGNFASTKSILSSPNKQPTPLTSKHNLSKSWHAYWIDAVAKGSTLAIMPSSSTPLCSMSVMIDKPILRLRNNYKFLLQSSANTPTKNLFIQTEGPCYYYSKVKLNRSNDAEQQKQTNSWKKMEIASAEGDQ